MIDRTTRRASQSARTQHPPTRPAPPLRIDIDPMWLDFGPDDPLDADQWINPCARCGRVPALRFEGSAHVVRCACGAQATPGRLAFTAAFNWNKSEASVHPHYRDLPFFQLDTLGIGDARIKLVTIRDYLELQKRRCEQEIRARRTVGHRYFQRIKAYLAWTIYALGLVKEAELGAGRDAAAACAQPHARAHEPGPH